MNGEEDVPQARRMLRGRQGRRPGKPRLVRHVVKVTHEQEERLLLAAAERRVTVARLMVESALSGGSDRAAEHAEMIGEMYRVSRLLGKVGVNINQIARATNTDLTWQEDTAAAVQAHGRVCERLDALLDRVEREVRP